MLVALVGGLSCLSHQARGFERLEALDVDLAPDAALAPGREADGVGVLAQRLAMPVDPPEAKRLVARLRPVDRRLATALLPEPDEKLGRGVVIGLEPLAKFGFGRKVGRLHACQRLLRR